MTSTLDTTPANPTTTPAEHDPEPLQTLLDCCALAWEGNPMTGLDVDPAYTSRIITTSRALHTDTELPHWREHTDPGQWNLRWRWARHLTQQHLGASAHAIPADHNDLPDALAAAHTATTTATTK